MSTNGTETWDLRYTALRFETAPGAKLKALVKACGNKLSRREIIELRAGRSKPHRKTLELVVGVLKKLKLI